MVTRVLAVISLSYVCLPSLMISIVSPSLNESSSVSVAS